MGMDTDPKDGYNESYQTLVYIVSKLDKTGIDLAELTRCGFLFELSQS